MESRLPLLGMFYKVAVSSTHVFGQKFQGGAPDLQDPILLHSLPDNFEEYSSRPIYSLLEQPARSESQEGLAGVVFRRQIRESLAQVSATPLPIASPKGADIKDIVE